MSEQASAPEPEPASPEAPASPAPARPSIAGRFDLPEKTFWELLPRRELRRAGLMVAALLVIIGIQRCSRVDVARSIERTIDPGAASATSARRARPAPRVQMNPLPAAPVPPSPAPGAAPR